MMSKDIGSRVIQVIARVQKISVTDISPLSTFDELGMDSFDAINLLFALEEEFDIQLPDEAKEYRRIDDTIKGITSLLLVTES